MKAELVIDKPPFYRSVRMGSWLHIFDYETGEGRWEHESTTADPICQCGHRIGSHTGGTYSCQVCDCGKFELLL